MNDKNYLLAIDNGTQSVRALLFDLQGNLLGKGKVELEAYYSKHPGWAEQDPEYYWAMLGEACRRLWDQVDIDRGLIRGVSLTTQRGTVIHVDAEGRPLRPAILWLDQRRAEVRERIRGPWGWLFKLVGAEGAVEHFRAQAEVNWVAQEQPEIAAKTDKVLLLSGFLSHRLTGRFVDSVGCCVATCRSTTSACAGPRRATGNGRRWRYAASSCRSCSSRASGSARSAPRPAGTPAFRKACR